MGFAIDTTMIGRRATYSGAKWVVRAIWINGGSMFMALERELTGDIKTFNTDTVTISMMDEPQEDEG